MSYVDLASHATMIFDETRNRAYLDALKPHLRPDSVVLDLGAGLGVLGLLAAVAGAKHVYCVEPAPVARHIAMLAQANGIGDRVTVMQSRIEDVHIPEPVDVLLSVFTGNLLFTEGLLPSLYYARDRFLKPDGVMLPDRSRLLLCGVNATAEYQSHVGRFREPSMGIDYSTLAPIAANTMVALSRKATTKPVAMTPATTAIELDFTRTDAEGVAFEGTVAASQDGVINAIMGWIEIGLGTSWLSTAPGETELHWSPMLLPLATPVSVRQGDEVDIGFRFIDDAQMFWSLRAQGVRQQQSPTLANPDILIDMMLSSPDRRGPLNGEALAIARVLSMMDEGASNLAIAAALASEFPQRYRDERQALKAVGRMAARYRAHPARAR